MKKILVVMPYFYPHKGGSQKYAEELYSKLISLYPNQYKIDILCYNTDQAVSSENYRGLNIYRIPCWQIITGRFAISNPIFLIKTLNKLAKNKYDFVNSQLVFFDPCWWVWAYAKIIGAKSIFTEHVATFPVYQNKVVEITAKLIEKTIGQMALHFYDYITVTNKAAADFLKKEFSINKKINLIYGGVDTNYFKSKKSSSRKLLNFNFKNNDIVVTFVGRLIWTKGVIYLYQAIKNLLPITPNNVFFIIAGGGELEDKLKVEIKRDKLENRVFLTGFISYEKVRDLLQISDIFINPSHHNEGFPNTILEAGACGNFVIATDNAGTCEVITNKKTGLLIKQKNQTEIEKSLLWAISHKKERQLMSENLHKVILKNFDWQIITQKYHQLLAG